MRRETRSRLWSSYKALESAISSSNERSKGSRQATLRAPDG
jgi:hypothetical protein